MAVACVDRSWQFIPGHYKIKLHVAEDENVNAAGDVHRFPKETLTLVSNKYITVNNIEIIVAQFVT